MSTTRRRLQSLIVLAGLVALPAAARDLAVTNVALHPSPGADRIDGATVIIRAGRIERLGVDLDTGTLPVLDGGGRVATAGLWNCHVHLTDPKLTEDPAPVLREMLLRYGFTSIVDTGSDLAATHRLEARIDAGDIDGPRVVTANGSLVFTDGTPSYLPGIRLPEVAAPAEGAAAVRRFLDAGADGIKIFSGSYQSEDQTVLLPAPVIAAITRAAHERDSFVIAHPTSRAGLVNAVDNGVNVLAHTAPGAGELEPALITRMLEAGIGLIPTLKLWSWELGRAGRPRDEIAAYEDAAVSQLRAFVQADGEVLFGTDVGYMRDYDPEAEYRLMARAGMGFPDLLASLTTDPSRRFAGEPGTVEPGAPGDLVIFAADPADDPAALARIAYTIREGRIVHAAEH